MIRLARKATPTCCKLSLNHCKAKWPSPAKRICKNSTTIEQLFAPSRSFSHSTRKNRNQKHRKETFTFRLRKALRNTRVQWRPIPIGLGIAFIGLFQIYRTQRKDGGPYAAHEEGRRTNDDPLAQEGRSASKTGPLHIRVLSTLPLKAISRWWGLFNELEIPYYLRVPGFRLYSWLFGVNLSEVRESDLHKYPNLASFFYRELKPGVRPIDPNPNVIVSPADGTVLQYGMIDNGKVEQVKGITYKLESLLGAQHADLRNDAGSSKEETGSESLSPHGQQGGEFAKINDISYTLPDLLSGNEYETKHDTKSVEDQATTPKLSSEIRVSTDISDTTGMWWTSKSAQAPTMLYYCVVYLAPGDYHRFHSPVNWLVERRRHFAGELYSVSPYLQKRLPGLFTINERVVLLGKWRWGFFSMTPVGATNVGSIKINFDKELRTNSLMTDTAASKAAEEALKRGSAYSGYAEATYEGANALMKGFALKRGEEMGGFQLGSTIVLIFEAPRISDNGNSTDSEPIDGLRWLVTRNQKIKVGQGLAVVGSAKT